MKTIREHLLKTLCVLHGQLERNINGFNKCGIIQKTGKYEPGGMMKKAYFVRVIISLLKK